MNGALCPAGIVIGRDKPLIEKRELLEVAPVTVTFAPLAVRVPDAVPLRLTNTLPSAIGAGVTAKVPDTVEPVPERATVNVGFEAFDVTVSVPLALPAEAGAKVTLKLALCPAASVAEVDPLKVNPVPLTATLEMVTVEPPVLVTVSASI